MTKRIATAAIALGVALMIFARPDSVPDAPLDKAWEFCTCAVYGHFHNIPLRVDNAPDMRTEGT